MVEGFDVVICLALGLLLAAAGQLLLITVGVALGLTLLDWSPTLKTGSESQSETGLSLPLIHLAGFAIAVSGSMVLFAASWLTAEFCQISEPQQGLVYGILLWSAYWVILVWFSTTRLVGLGSALLGTAVASGRQLIATGRQLFRPRSSAVSDQQALLHDLTAEVSQLTDLQRQLPDLLAQQRQVLIAEIVERTDLSSEQAESVVTGLSQHTAGMEPSPGSPQPSSQSSSHLLAQLDLPSWQQLARQLLRQIDLSDVDLESLWQQLQSLREKSPGPEAPPSANVIYLDAEDYISQAPLWSLQPEVIEQEFDERLYDAGADPGQIQKHLAELTRSDFISWLQARGDLTAERIETIADDLNRVQQLVLERLAEPTQLAAAEPPPDLPEVAEKMLAYCRYTNLDALTPEGITEKIETLREEFDLPEDKPLSTYGGVDMASLTEVLARRQGLSDSQQQSLTQALVTALEAQPASPARDTARFQQVRQRLENYFQGVDWATVSLEDIKPEVMGQLQSLDLRGNLDWPSLASQLQVPQEIKTDLVSWLQEVGRTLSRQPRRWAMRVGKSTRSLAKYLIRQIIHYLKFQDKSAFNPESMAKDLAQILKSAVEILPNPTDWESLSDLTGLVDADALRATLEARRDMTTDQIQPVVAMVETAWKTVADQVLTWTQAVWSEAQHWLNPEVGPLDTARQQLVDRIADTRKTLEQKAARVKAELQNQADAARRQVAIAAWWFLVSLLSSAGAATAAGWLAVRY